MCFKATSKEQASEKKENNGASLGCFTCCHEYEMHGEGAAEAATAAAARVATVAAAAVATVAAAAI